MGVSSCMRLSREYERRERQWKYLLCVSFPRREPQSFAILSRFLVLKVFLKRISLKVGRIQMQQLVLHSCGLCLARVHCVRGMLEVMVVVFAVEITFPPFFPSLRANSVLVLFLLRDTNSVIAGYTKTTETTGITAREQNPHGKQHTKPKRIRKKKEPNHGRFGRKEYAKKSMKTNRQGKKRHEEKATKDNRQQYRDIPNCK